MALPQGINFRSSSGYVTDPAGSTYDTGTLTYPRTTSQGNTVGWESVTSLQKRDRSTAIDPRLAGIIFITAPATATFRIDLPAPGAYGIRLAAGDYSARNRIKVEVFDDSTSLGVLADGLPAGGSFYDAAGNVWTTAQWPTSNVAVEKTFSTSIARFVTGRSDISGVYVSIAHLAVEELSGGSGLTVGLSGHAYEHEQGLPTAALDVAAVGQSYSFAPGALSSGVNATSLGQSYAHAQGVLIPAVGANATLALSGSSYSVGQGAFANTLAVGAISNVFAHSAGVVASSVGSNVTLTLAGQSVTLTQGEARASTGVVLTGKTYAPSQGPIVATVTTAAVGGEVTLSAATIEAIADAVMARISAGLVSADVKRINGVTITGNGSSEAFGV